MKTKDGQILICHQSTPPPPLPFSMQTCQAKTCGKQSQHVGETASGPRSVCSATCLINLMSEMNIDSEAGDDLARLMIKPKFTIAFDFDLTLTNQHSCTGKDSPFVAKDMSEHVDAAALGELFLWLRNSGRLNWIISFGNVNTIRETMSASGLGDFFRVPVGDVPATVREHRMYDRMVKDGHFWRILTPSVMFETMDCVKPRNFDDVYKVSFMNTAITITNMFLSEKENVLVAPREFMLIDDTEENVTQCTRKGFSGLAINPRNQLVNSLDFTKANEKKETGDLNWLQLLFDRVELVEKEESLWGTDTKEKWNYYKIK